MSQVCWVYAGEELKWSGRRRVEFQECGPKKRRRVKVWLVGKIGHPQTVTPATFERMRQAAAR